MIIFRRPDVAPAHAVHRATTDFLHRPARSLRRPISLLSMFGAVAGVQLRTSQSIKPRERDLGDLHLFFLVRILTRPTNHPRHAACASNNQSKPVRPHFSEWRSLVRRPEKAISLTVPIGCLLAGRFPASQVAYPRVIPSPQRRLDLSIALV